MGKNRASGIHPLWLLQKLQRSWCLGTADPTRLDFWRFKGKTTSSLLTVSWGTRLRSWNHLSSSRHAVFHFLSGHPSGIFLLHLCILPLSLLRNFLLHWPTQVMQDYLPTFSLYVQIIGIRKWLSLGGLWPALHFAHLSQPQDFFFQLFLLKVCVSSLFAAGSWRYD